MPATPLLNRAVVQIMGAEAKGFLQGLLTCNVDQLSPGTATYGALLSPQGKILTDFLLGEAHDGALLFDLPSSQAADFIKRLTLYRLRAKVIITLLPDAWVEAVWGDATAGQSDTARVFSDPRHPSLGQRVLHLTPRPDSQPMGATADAYEAHRVGLGIPQGGLDFPYGDTFPHDANLDVLHGVDFHKGCYVGQEVVSRVQHRGSARKRIMKVWFSDGAAKTGSAVMAADRDIGTLGSVSGDQGLALLRTDRLDEATAAGVALSAEGRMLTVETAN